MTRGTAITHAVQSAIAEMKSDPECPGGITAVAERSFYSKYHFTREFSRITGTTPRRYLAAIRMERAKRYLAVDRLSVAAVSHLVGYASVGTFSTRFTELVGVAPRAWREAYGECAVSAHVVGTGPTVCRGRLSVPRGLLKSPTKLYVGAFPDSIIQGRPLASTVVCGPGEFTLEGVPDLPVTVVACVAVRPADGDPTATRIYGYARRARPDQTDVQVRLRPQAPTDPPLVLACQTGLGRLGRASNQ